MSSTAPIKIYLGTQIEQSLATAVLTHSIVSHTQHPVEITPLYEAVAAANITVPMPANPQLKPRTPFTFQRFAIPELCQYQGKAIYLDSDMLVFRDINDIWQQSFDLPGHSANGQADLLSVPEPVGSQRSPQYSVMLLNCAQLQWNMSQLVDKLQRGTWTYQQFVLEMSPAPRKLAALPPGWNDLECYDPARTALLHYTDMLRQPWLSVVNPLTAIWCDALLKAIAAGVISRATVQHSVDQGWARPSLLHQIDYGIAEPQRLPDDILQRDRHTFTPPHVWQKYLKYPMLQGRRSRQLFSFTYAALRTTADKIKTVRGEARNV